MADAIQVVLRGIPDQGYRLRGNREFSGGIAVEESVEKAHGKLREGLEQKAGEALIPYDGATCMGCDGSGEAEVVFSGTGTFQNRVNLFRALVHGGVIA